MVEYRGDYRWSSYRANVLGREGQLITPYELYSRLAPAAADRQYAYRELFRRELEGDAVHRIRVTTGCSMPLGDNRFVTRWRQCYNGASGMKGEAGFSGMILIFLRPPYASLICRRFSPSRLRVPVFRFIRRMVDTVCYRSLAWPVIGKVCQSLQGNKKMNCPEIGHLTLSDESKKAIERIKKKPGPAKALNGAMAAGQIVNIFVSPTPPAATMYTIHSTEWGAFASAMAGVPSIARASMEKEAYNQWVSAQMRNNHSELQFWTAVYDGCLFR